MITAQLKRHRGLMANGAIATAIGVLCLRLLGFSIPFTTEVMLMVGLWIGYIVVGYFLVRDEQASDESEGSESTRPEIIRPIGIRASIPRAELPPDLPLPTNADEMLRLAQQVTRKLQEHDMETWRHAHRVQDMAVAIGKEIGLGKNSVARLGLAALLHDAGKLTVAPSLLNTPDQLSPEQHRAMQNHVAEGIKLCEFLTPWLGQWIGGIAEHHERWDGLGYPNRHTGTDISLSGRIVALAEAYDAMTNSHPYAPAMSKAEACDELRLGAGTQFDPRLVSIVVAMLGADEEAETAVVANTASRIPLAARVVSTALGATLVASTALAAVAVPLPKWHQGARPSVTAAAPPRRNPQVLGHRFTHNQASPTTTMVPSESVVAPETALAAVNTPTTTSNKHKKSSPTTSPTTNSPITVTTSPVTEPPTLGNYDARIYGIYAAVLGRLPTSAEADASAAKLNSGTDVAWVAWDIVNSPAGVALYGSGTHDDGTMITAFFNNALCRPPTGAEYKQYVGQAGYAGVHVQISPIGMLQEAAAKRAGKNTPGQHVC